MAEEQAFAQEANADRERYDTLKDNLPLVILFLLILGTLPGAALCYTLWRKHGREPVVPDKEQYILEPPGDDPPAVVAALLDESSDKVKADAFTATLFDLVRRRQVDAIMTSTEQKSWGGLRREDVSDLALKLTPRPEDQLTTFEKEVIQTIGRASQGAAETGAGPRLMLTQLKARIQAEPTYFAARYENFRKKVVAALNKRGWWIESGKKPVLIAVSLGYTLALAAGVGSPLLYNELAAVPWMTIYLGAFAIVTIVNTAVITGFLIRRRGWERRSPAGAVDAAKWNAFRHFLEDSPGMKEAVPGSIAIWEKYLCYAIAFGVADKVLEAARIHAPELLTDTSYHGHWFVYYTHNSYYSSSSGFGFSSISSAMAAAQAPSSSGSGGGSPVVEGAEVVVEAAEPGRFLWLRRSGGLFGVVARLGQPVSPQRELKS